MAAGVQTADEVVFPEAMDTQGHEVVHCVVRGGNGAEDGTDCRVVQLATAFGMPVVLIARKCAYPSTPSMTRQCSRNRNASSSHHCDQAFARQDMAKTKRRGQAKV